MRRPERHDGGQAPATRRVSRRTQVRLVVWFTATLFVAVAGWGSGQPLPSPQLPQAEAPTVEAAGLLRLAPSQQGADSTLVSRYCNDAEVRAGTCGNKEDSIGLLPAWRWRDASQLASNYGASDVAAGKPIMSTIATFFFALAQFIWGLLLWVIKIALDLNLADVAATQINQAFAKLGGALGTGSGLVVIIVLVGLIAAVRALLQGHLPRAFGIALAVLIPVATLQVMTGLSTGATGGTGSLSPTGSAGWVAQRGVGLVNDVGYGVADSMRTLSGQSSKAAGFTITDAGFTGSPDCAPYVQALYSQYNLMNGSRVADKKTAGQFEGNNPGATITLSDQVSTVSWLWERSFLSGYVQAQFNSLPLGERMYCHHMELEANVDPAIQVTVAKIAYGTTPPQPTTDALFRSLGDQKDGEAQTFGWAACAYEGGTWKMDDDWKVAGMVSDPVDTCQKWWDGGGTNIKSFKWATQYDLTAGSTNIGTVDPAAGADAIVACMDARNEVSNNRDLTDTERAEQYEDLKGDGEACDTAKVTVGAPGSTSAERANEAVTAYWGHNVGARLFGGLLALATALMYGYALGSLAVGSIIAQFGLVIMLILLPGTLLLLAFPGRKSGNPSSMHMAGRRLLRMTGGFFAAQLAFVLVMVALVQIILIFEALVGGQGGSLWNMLIPLAALFMIRKIIKSMGLGDITTPAGALGLTTAAAVGADGRAMLERSRAQRRNRNEDKERAGGAKPGDRLRDKYAARLRAGTLGRRLAQANAAGKKLASSEFGQRHALAQRWAQVFGNKKTGQLGLAQQMRTLAGLNALARGGNNPNTRLGRMLDKAPSLMGDSALAKKLDPMIDRFAYRNNQKAKMAEIAANQRAARRAEIAAVTGKNREQRAEVRRQASERFHELGQRRLQVARDANGQALKTADGKDLYGYQDAAGNRFAVNTEGKPIDAKGAVLATAGLSAITEPRKHFGDAAVIEQGRQFMEANGLRGEGDMVVGPWGEAPQVRPRLATADGRNRLPQGKKESDTVNLVRSAPTWALAEEQKAKPPGMTDGAYSFYLARMEEAMGCIDPETGARVDLAREHGIDLDSEVGRAELRKAQMGQPSAFDKIQIAVPADVHAAALSAAMMLDRKDGPRAELIAEARQERTAQVRGMADAARADVTVMQTRAGAAATTRTALVSAATKLDALPAKIDAVVPQLETARLQVQEAEAQYQATISSLDRPGQATDLIGLVVDYSTVRASAGGARPSFEEWSGLPSGTYEQGVQAAGALQTFMSSSSRAAEIEDQYADLETQKAALERAMREAQSQLIDHAESSIDDVLRGARDAEALKYSFQLIMADKNKADTGAIIQAADDFETKFLPDIAAKLKADVDAATAELLEATASGDTTRIRQAAQSLEGLNKREYARTAAALNEAAAKFPSMIQEIELAELQADHDLKRQTLSSKIRSKDLADASASFPN
jgi:hypothetical protein